MSRILERIVADMKPALEAAKRNVPFPEMKKRAENARAPKNFVQAFQDRSRTNVIAELKKASELGLQYYAKLPEPLPKSSREYEYRHEPVDLLKALYSIYSRGGKAPEPDISQAVPQRIIYSVRDKSRQVLLRLKTGSASLQELYKSCRSRSEIVATFMSILELCSVGSIHIQRRDEDYILEFAGGDVDEIMEKILE